MLASTKHDPTLSHLRHDLSRLRRRRAAVRRGTAVAIVGLIVVAALAVAFAIDYLFDPGVVQRAIALLAIAFAAGWIASRFAGPWLGHTETDADVALLVEKQHGLSNEFIAALQFDSDAAASWGSPRLERAVIHEADETSRRIDLLEGFTWKPLPRWLGLFGFSLISAVALCVVFPAYAGAFLQRFMLADVPYPTRTTIVSVLIDSEPIDLSSQDPLRAPVGSALTFTVVAGGQAPDAGEVILENEAQATTAIGLERQVNPPSEEPRYAGTLEALTEPVTFSVRLGDATTRPRRIELVPRPAITLDLKPTPPDYARSNAPSPPPPGVRTASVLEGSSVGIDVHSANKPLQRATIRVVQEQPDASSKSHSIALKPSADRHTWTLEAPGTPFALVRKPIAFEVDVVDDDGLSPAGEIKGMIRLRADRPPRVAAAAVVRRVLPEAAPQLTYGATDDFGIAAVRAKLAVTRGDGTSSDAVVLLPVERESPQQVRGRHPIDLSSLNLSKGDRVIVTVEAEDARGDMQGEIATAEPITFEVTDREGLLASLLESDTESAERLDAIIRRELGIGDFR